MRSLDYPIGDLLISKMRTLAALLLIVVAGCSPTPPDSQSYTTQIASERASKDEMFRSGKNSPVRPDEIGVFVPLSYFAIDEAYAVPAQLQPAAERVSAQMPTSTGKLRELALVGSLVFTLKGQPLKLAAFMEEGSSQLFVPFSDLTSGTETYQAGRYMNLDPSPSGIYIVDFNVAYHPYCYYNAEYDCPFPPAENRLTLPIRAGERLRKADTMVPR